MTFPILADGSASSPDTGATTFLFIGLALFGAVAYARLKGRAFTGLPRWVGWASAAAAAACLVLVFVLPPIINPASVEGRPHTTATISFVEPTNGQVFHGSPASVPITVHVDGGTIVNFTSTHLVPDKGHVHLYLDGNMVLMSYGSTTTLPIDPGRHQLMAEFVAVDHGPFKPRVLATVTIVVKR